MTFMFASLPYPYTGPSGSDSTPKWHLKPRPSSLQSSWQFLESYQPLVVYAASVTLSVLSSVPHHSPFWRGPVASWSLVGLGWVGAQVPSCPTVDHRDGRTRQMPTLV